MDLNLKNKKVLVTGGCQGIGLACVKAFLNEQSKVIMVDKDYKKGEKLCKEFRKKGNDVNFFSVDLSDEQSIFKMLNFIEREYNYVDICINNAGVTFRSDVLEIQLEDFKRVLNINLIALFIISQNVAKNMVKFKVNGSITNIGSVNSILALPDNPAYVASKGGVLQLTKSMSIAMAKHNIRVNLVGPGSINTPLQRSGMSRSKKLKQMVLSRTPLNRLGEPEEVADAVLYISSEKASYITGECLYVDGGRLPLNFLV